MDEPVEGREMHEIKGLSFAVRAEEKERRAADIDRRLNVRVRAPMDFTHDQLRLSLIRKIADDTGISDAKITRDQLIDESIGFWLLALVDELKRGQFAGARELISRIETNYEKQCSITIVRVRFLGSSSESVFPVAEVSADAKQMLHSLDFSITGLWISARKREQSLLEFYKRTANVLEEVIRSSRDQWFKGLITPADLGQTIAANIESFLEILALEEREKVRSGSLTRRTAAGQIAIGVISSFAASAIRDYGMSIFSGSEKERSSNPETEVQESSDSFGALEEGSALLEIGNFEDARKAFEEALSLTPNESLPYLGIAICLMEEQQTDEALAWINSALRLDPENPLPWYFNGLLLSRLGAWEQALDCLDASLRLDPTFSRAWVAKAEALLASGSIASASECVDEAAKLNPEDPVVWIARGTIGARTERYEESKMAFTTAIGSFGESPPYWASIAWLGRGTAHLMLNQHSEALADSISALRIMPESPEALLLSANAHRELGENESALIACNHLITFRAEDASVFVLKGKILLDLEQFEESLDAFTQALRLREDECDAAIGQGLSFMQLKRFSEALVAFYKGTQCQPESFIAWFGLGEVLTAVGMHELAGRTFYRATQLDDASSDAWSGLGFSQFVSGEMMMASFSFYKALSLDPNNNTAKAGIEAMLRRLDS